MAKPRSNQKRGARSQGQAARIADQRRREARRRALWIAGAGVAVVVGIVAVVLSGDRGSAPAGVPAGTISFDGGGRDHVDGTVDYDRTPPAGGNHAPVWQNCGVYGEPVLAEQGVHSMEHGAVWITYRPDLERSEVDLLTTLADGQEFVLVSPWKTDLPSPVVASAWGRQLQVSSATDPRLKEFVRTFQVGPQTPEPGAPAPAASVSRNEDVNERDPSMAGHQVAPMSRRLDDPAVVVDVVP